MTRIPFINGDEQDVLGSKSARTAIRTWDRPGKTSAVKRSYRRRERRMGRDEIAAQLAW